MITILSLLILSCACYITSIQANIFIEMKYSIEAIQPKNQDSVGLKQRSLNFVDKLETRIGNNANVLSVVPVMSNSISGLMSGNAVDAIQSVLNIASSASALIPPPIGTPASILLGLASSLFGLGTSQNNAMQNMLDAAVDEIISALNQMQLTELKGRFEDAKGDYSRHQYELLNFAKHTGNINECTVNENNQLWDIFLAQVEKMRRNDNYLDQIKAHIESVQANTADNVLQLLYGFCYIAIIRESTLLSAMGEVASQKQNCDVSYDTRALENVYDNLEDAHAQLLDSVQDVLEFTRTNLILAEKVTKLQSSDDKYPAIYSWLQRDFDGKTYPILFLFSGQGNWGEWDEVEMCDDGTYIVKIEQRIEISSFTDICGLVRMYFTCVNYNGGYHNYHYVGRDWNYGYWYENTQCNYGFFVESIKNCIQPSQGSGDDFGQLSLLGTCGDGNGIGVYTYSCNGATEVKCPPNHVVCGMATKFEDWQGKLADDTCITETAARCCEVN
eukprot:87750_1